MTIDIRVKHVVAILLLLIAVECIFLEPMIFGTLFALVVIVVSLGVLVEWISANWDKSLVKRKNSK